MSRPKILNVVIFICIFLVSNLFAAESSTKSKNQTSTFAASNDNNSNFRQQNLAKKIDHVIVNRFLEYLNKMDSFIVDFTQKTKKTTAYGSLLVKKPGRMRCNYYEPYPLLITSNKNQTSIYDYEMEQLSSVNPKESPFYFLLSKNISLDSNFEIVYALTGPDGDLISLKHLDTGTLIHILISKSTGHLSRLIISQPASEEIEVEFGKINSVSWFDDSLFTIRNPSVFGIPTRLTQDKLKNFYKTK